MHQQERIINWIDNILLRISMAENGATILHNCGADCAGVSEFLEVATDLSKNPQRRSDASLFDTFKTRCYDSPNFTMDGNRITLILEECTCPLVKAGVSNSFICECTKGYSHKVFETLFNRKVHVVLEESILKGDPVCRQSIFI